MASLQSLIVNISDPSGHLSVGSNYAIVADGGFIVSQEMGKINALAEASFNSYDVTDAVQLRFDARIFNRKLGIIKDASNIHIIDTSYNTLWNQFPNDTITITADDFLSSLQPSNVVSVGRYATLYSDFFNYVQTYFGYSGGFSSLFLHVNKQTMYNDGVFDASAFVHILHGMSDSDSGAQIRDMSGSITISNVNMLLRHAVDANVFGNRDPSGTYSYLAAAPDCPFNFGVGDGFMQDDIIWIPQGTTIKLDVGVSIDNFSPLNNFGPTMAEQLTMESTWESGLFSSNSYADTSRLTRTLQAPLMLRLYNFPPPAPIDVSLSEPTFQIINVNDNPTGNLATQFSWTRNPNVYCVVVSWYNYANNSPYLYSGTDTYTIYALSRSQIYTVVITPFDIHMNPGVPQTMYVNTYTNVNSIVASDITTNSIELTYSGFYSAVDISFVDMSNNQILVPHTNESPIGFGGFPLNTTFVFHITPYTQGGSLFPAGKRSLTVTTLGSLSDVSYSFQNSSSSSVYISWNGSYYNGNVTNLTTNTVTFFNSTNKSFESTEALTPNTMYTYAVTIYNNAGNPYTLTVPTYTWPSTSNINLLYDPTISSATNVGFRWSAVGSYYDTIGLKNNTISSVVPSVFWYKFDSGDINGSTLYNYGNFSYGGSFNTSQWNISLVSPKYGTGCFLSTTQNTQITLGSHTQTSATQANGYTVCFWMKLAGVPQSGTPNILYTGNSSKGINIAFNSASTTKVITFTQYVNTTNNNNNFITWNATTLDSNWHHFALTVTSTAGLTLYVDGQQATYYTSGSTYSAFDGNNMTQTYYLNNPYGNSCYYDDFRMYNTTLSSAQVFNIFINDTLSPVTTYTKSSAVAFYNSTGVDTLVPNTMYSYKVYLTNAYGTTVTTSVNTYTWPSLTGLNLTYVNGSSTASKIYLTWSNSGNYTTISIQNLTIPNSTVTTYTAASGKTFYDSSGIDILPAGQDFTYQITLANAYGSTVSTTITTYTLPSASGLAFTYNPVLSTTTTAYFSWTNIGYYQITIQNTTITGGVTQLYTKASNTTTYNSSGIDSTLTPGKTYNYRVILSNAYGNTVTVNYNGYTWPSFTGLNPIYDPSNSNASSVGFKWTNTANYYTIGFTNTTLSSTTVTSFTTASNTTTYNTASVDTTLLPNRIYTYTITLANQYGSKVTQTILGYTWPSTNGLSLLYDPSNSTVFTVKFSWVNTSYYDTMTLQNTTISSGLITYDNSLNVANTTYDSTNKDILDVGKTYVYKITLYNTYGTSVSTNISTFTLPDAQYLQLMYDVSNSTATSVGFNWINKGYTNLQFKNLTVSNPPIKTLNYSAFPLYGTATYNTSPLESLSPDTSYNYLVTLLNEANFSVSTNVTAYTWSYVSGLSYSAALSTPTSVRFSWSSTAGYQYITIENIDISNATVTTITKESGITYYDSSSTSDVLEPNSTYRYRITQVNMIGTQTPTTITTYTLADFTGLNLVYDVSNSTSNTIQFGWSLYQNNYTKLTIQNTTLTGAPVSTYMYNAGTVLHNSSGKDTLAAGRTYTYVVTLYNQNNTGTQQTYTGYSLPSLTGLNMVQDLFTNTETTVQFSWTNIGYTTIVLQNIDISDATVTSYTNTSETTFYDSSMVDVLLPNGIYRYLAILYNDYGSTVQYTLTTYTRPSLDGLNLTYNNANSSSRGIYFHWALTGYYTSLEIQNSDICGNITTVTANSGQTYYDSSGIDTTLQPNQIYVYEMTLYNTVSQKISTYVTTYTYPSVDGLNVLYDPSSSSQSNVHFTWNATGYDHMTIENMDISSAAVTTYTLASGANVYDSSGIDILIPDCSYRYLFTVYNSYTPAGGNPATYVLYTYTWATFDNLDLVFDPSYSSSNTIFLRWVNSGYQTISFTNSSIVDPPTTTYTTASNQTTFDSSGIEVLYTGTTNDYVVTLTNHYGTEISEIFSAYTTPDFNSLFVIYNPLLSTSNSIVLSWANKGYYQFIVQNQTIPNSPISTYNIISSLTTYNSSGIDTLQPNQSYDYTVTLRNQLGETISNTITTYTYPSFSGLNLLYDVSNSSTSSVQITWNNTGYYTLIMIQNMTVPGSQITTYSAASNIVSYNSTDIEGPLSINTTYMYKITLTNMNGMTISSTLNTYTWPSLTGLNLTYDNANSSASKIRLTWVKTGLYKTISIKNTTIVGGTTTTYTDASGTILYDSNGIDTTLQAGQTYVYKVTIANAYGTTFSQNVTAYTLPSTSGFSFAYASGSSTSSKIVLTWANSGYSQLTITNIDISSAAVTTFTKLSGTVSYNSNGIDTTLQPSTAYRYLATLNNEFGNTVTSVVTAYTWPTLTGLNFLYDVSQSTAFSTFFNWVNTGGYTTIAVKNTSISGGATTTYTAVSGRTTYDSSGIDVLQYSSQYNYLVTLANGNGSTVTTNVTGYTWPSLRDLSMTFIYDPSFASDNKIYLIWNNKGYNYIDIQNTDISNGTVTQYDTNTVYYDSSGKDLLLPDHLYNYQYRLTNTYGSPQVIGNISTFTLPTFSAMDLSWAPVNTDASSVTIYWNNTGSFAKVEIINNTTGELVEITVASLKNINLMYDVSNSSPTNVRFHWNNSGYYDTIYIQNADISGSPVISYTASSNITTYNSSGIETLQPGRAYTYNITLTSTYNSSVSTTITTYTWPSFTDFNFTYDGSGSTNTSAHFTWQDTGYYSEFTIQNTDISGGGIISTISKDSGITSYDSSGIDTLLAGYSYNYRVKLYNDFGTVVTGDYMGYTKPSLMDLSMTFLADPSFSTARSIYLDWENYGYNTISLHNQSIIQGAITTYTRLSNITSYDSSGIDVLQPNASYDYLITLYNGNSDSVSEVITVYTLPSVEGLNPQYDPTTSSTSSIYLDWVNTGFFTQISIMNLSLPNSPAVSFSVASLNDLTLTYNSTLSSTTSIYLSWVNSSYYDTISIQNVDISGEIVVYDASSNIVTYNSSLAAPSDVLQPNTGYNYKVTLTLGESITETNIVAYTWPVFTDTINVTYDVSNSSINSIRFVWSDTSSYHTIKIQNITVPNSPATTYTAVSGILLYDSSGIESPLSPGNMYQYTITLYNSYGTSVAQTFYAYTIPDVTGFTQVAYDASNSSTSSLALTWQNRGYSSIQIRDVCSNEVTYTSLGGVVSYDSSNTILQLSAGQTYNYIVTLYNEYGTSASETISTYTWPSLDGFNVGYDMSASSVSSVAFTWENQGYSQISIQNLDISYSIVTTYQASSGVIQYDSSGIDILSPGKTYRYQFSLFNEYGREISTLVNGYTYPSLTTFSQAIYDVSNSSPTSVVFSWPTASGYSQIAIQNNDISGSPVTIYQASSGVLHYDSSGIDTGLLPNQTYNYTLTLTNDIGVPTVSTTLATYTYPYATTLPLYDISNSSTSSVAFTWENQGYDVITIENLDVSSSLIPTLYSSTSGETAFVDENSPAILPGATYRYLFTFYNIYGTKATYIVHGYTYPSLTAFSQAIYDVSNSSPSSVAFSWPTASGYSQIAIQNNDISGSPVTTYQASSGVLHYDSSGIDTGLLPNQTYHYTLTLTNDIGIPAVDTVVATNTYPSITGLTYDVANSTTASVAFTWENVGYYETISIQNLDISDSVVTSYTAASGTTSFHSDGIDSTPLLAGHKYRYAITATNSVGTQVQTILDTYCLPSLTDLSMTYNPATSSSNSVNISWNPTGYFTSMEIMNLTTQSSITMTDPSVSNYTSSNNLSASTKYTYLITIYNAYGSTSTTTIDTYTLPSLTNLNLYYDSNVSTSSYVYFQWQNQGYTTISIQNQTLGGEITTYSSSSNTFSHYSVDTLTPSTTYTYEITLANEAGYTVSQTIQAYTLPTLTGLNPIYDVSQSSISSVSFSWTNSGGYSTISITNMDISGGTTTIDTSASNIVVYDSSGIDTPLSPGETYTYSLELANDNGNTTMQYLNTYTYPLVDLANVQYDPSNSSPTSVALSWTNTGYKVITLQNITMAESPITTYTSSSGTVTYDSSGMEADLQPNTSYTYEIVAKNDYGVTSTTSVATTTMAQLAQLYYDPSYATATSVSIFWDNSAATYENIYIQNITIPDSTTTSYTYASGVNFYDSTNIDTLSPGSMYEYLITVTNSAGYEMTTTVNTYTLSTMDGINFYYDPVNSSPTNAQFTWTYNGYSTKTIQNITLMGAISTYSADSGIFFHDTSSIDTLEPNTQYTYQYTLANENGIAVSNQVTITTPPSFEATQFTYDVTRSSTSSIFFTWINSGYHTITIQNMDISGSISTTFSGESGEINYGESSLQVSTTYNYMVTLTNTAGYETKHIVKAYTLPSLDSLDVEYDVSHSSATSVSLRWINWGYSTVSIENMATMTTFTVPSHEIVEFDSADVETLIPGHKYVYRISIANEYGTTLSTYVDAYTLPSLVGLNASFTDLGPYAVQFNWLNTDYYSWMTIQNIDVSDSEITTYTSASRINVHSTTDTLQAATKYRYQFTLYNEYGSSVSEILTTYTIPSIDGFSIHYVNTQSSIDSVYIEWTNSGYYSISVENLDISNATVSTFYANASGATIYDSSGIDVLEPGRTYRYEITLANENSDILAFVVYAYTLPWLENIHYEEELSGERDIAITWTNQGYHKISIFHSDVSGSPISTFTAASNITHYHVHNLLPNQVYNYTYIVYNEHGDSMEGDIVAYTLPSFEGLQVEYDASNASVDTIEFTWNGDTEYYHTISFQNVDISDSSIVTYQGDETRHMTTNDILSPGKAYTYEVTIANSNGSTLIDTIVGYTLPSMTEMELMQDTTRSSDTLVFLQWKNIGYDTMTIQRLDNSGGSVGPMAEITSESNTTLFGDFSGDLQPNTIYPFEISLYNPIGDSLSFIVPACTMPSFELLDILFDISNSTTNAVQFDWINEGYTTISIENITIPNSQKTTITSISDVVQYNSYLYEVLSPGEKYMYHITLANPLGATRTMVLETYTNPSITEMAMYQDGSTQSTVTLKWMNIGYYKLTIQNIDIPNSPVIEFTSNSNITEFVGENLEPDTSYLYEIVVYNEINIMEISVIRASTMTAA